MLTGRMPMSTYQTLCLWFCAVLLGAGVTGEAKAQAPAPVPQPQDVYAAKFTCGQIPPGTNDTVTDVVRGVYATSINIHNPQSTVPVKYNKTIVVAKQEIQPPQPQPAGLIVKFTSLSLPAEQAEFVDCQFIYRQFTSIRPGTHIEGFVVIEIPTTASGPALLLDVVGKYTARPSNGEVSSLDVVVYNAKRITQ